MAHKMVIFHRYISLPEGNTYNFFMSQPLCHSHWWLHEGREPQPLRCRWVMGLKRDMIGDFSTSHFADHPRAVPAGDDHRDIIGEMI